MSNSELSRCINLAGRVLLAYAIVFGPAAAAGQNEVAKGKTQSSATSTTQPSAQKQSPSAATAVLTEKSQTAVQEHAVSAQKSLAKGSREGIKVHGHWAIEVRNPDGSVVTHREFENALGLSGGSSLVAVLSRGGSVGFWKIQLNDPNGSANAIGPCINSANNKGSDCEVIEPGWASVQGTLSFQFPTLTVSSIAQSGTSPAQLVLSGTAVASVTDSIGTVATLLNTCPATVAPSSPCATSSQFLFTFASANSVNVTAGQTIAVTVTISFS
jgi:hypothetical protein